MQRLLAFSVTIWMTFQGSSAQCTEANQIAFISGLPNALSCGFGFLQANNTPTGQTGMDALDTICTTSCAGTVAQWLANPSTCNDTESSAGLGFWCQPADSGNIPRCRWALDLAPPDLFDNNNINSCALATSSICPQTCAVGLANLTSYIGCCYQFIYNNTEALDALQGRGYITATERQLLTALSQASLWQLCNVDTPPACSSPTFRDDTTTTVTPTTMVVTTASGSIVSFSVAVLLVSFLCALMD